MSDMLWTRAALDGTPGEDRSIDVIASTEAEDAHETRIRQNWNLRRYLANPVVLWSHDSYGLPIGTASAVRVEGGQLKARVTFSTAELNPMAEQVLQNVRAGVVKGVSVGFCPENVFEDFSTEGDGDMIYVLDAPELFEISICPVPSNPETLAQLRSRAISSRAAVPYKAFPADEKSAWDASAAVARIRKWASSDGSGDKDKIDWAKYAQGFAYIRAASD